MAKKAAAQNGRADLPVSPDARLVASKQSGDGQRAPTTKKENSLSSGERAGVRVDKIYAKPSSLLDTRVIYCGDNLEQLAKLPDACNSAFRTPHSAIAVTGSFYYHCDWHASHYVKVMLDQISGENNFQNEIVHRINWAGTRIDDFCLKMRRWLPYNRSKQFKEAL